MAYDLWTALRSPTPFPQVRALSTYSLIYSIVRKIPRGTVATYGHIAALAGMPGHARQVGYAMHALPAHTTVPWHRVINARGEISRRRRGGGELEQRALLEREGIRFDRRGRVSVERFGWKKVQGSGCRVQGARLKKHLAL